MKNLTKLNIKFARVFGAIDSRLGSKLYPKKSKPLAILPIESLTRMLLHFYKVKINRRRNRGE